MPMHNILPLPFFHVWAYLQTQPLLGLTATLCTWELACIIDAWAGHKAVSNPTVLSIIILAAALLVTRTPYSAYFTGAQYVHFLLGPATVALAIPMYANLPAIKRHFMAIIISLTAGSVTAAASAMLIAKALGAPGAVVISLGPKSVTTPIAMGIAQDLGGQPSLTAVFVMITGMFGTLVCTGVFRLARIRDWRAQGLAAGTAAHGLATSHMLRLNETAGAFGGLAIGLNGIVTSLALPLLVKLIGP
jgi:predicted murein hydrolase (TIGR00659 family)